MKKVLALFAVVALTSFAACSPAANDVEPAAEAEAVQEEVKVEVDAAPAAAPEAAAPEAAPAH